MSHGNKKIRISASSQHLTKYLRKHVCFKHICKEILDACNLREDEKGHGVVCVVLAGSDEGIRIRRNKNGRRGGGTRRGLLGTSGGEH